MNKSTIVNFPDIAKKKNNKDSLNGVLDALTDFIKGVSIVNGKAVSKSKIIKHEFRQ